MNLKVIFYFFNNDISVTIGFIELKTSVLQVINAIEAMKRVSIF